MPTLVAAYDPYLFVWDGTNLYSTNAVPPLAWVQRAPYPGPGVIQNMVCAINEVGGQPALYTVDDQLACYYFDRVSNAWYSEGTGIWNAPSAAAGAFTEEVGSIKAWPSATAPASWMLCDGSAISRTTYSNLYSVIGTTYGAGDGSTTFNLPDLRGRFLLGTGAGTGLTSRALAANGGEETHVLSVAELANHTHSIAAGAFSHTHTVTDPGHSHTVNCNQATGTGYGASGTVAVVNAGSSLVTLSAKTGVTATDAATLPAGATAAAGSSTGHNTMPPFLVVTYIIKVSPSGGATAQAPLADATQSGLLRQVSGNTTDFVDGSNHCQNLVTAINPTIWAMRLRSFNAVGNPNSEVDQRWVGTLFAAPVIGNRLGADRWFRASASGTSALVCSTQQAVVPVLVPNTNFRISGNALTITLTTAQATLAASDLWAAVQTIEGSVLRELIGDVHSVSILAYTNISGGLKFGLSLRDNGVSRSLTKLCTIPAANTWTLITLPNIPAWDSGGTWGLTPGAAGYTLAITLAAGSTYTSPANDTWQSNASFFGAVGQDNFGSKPTGSYLYLGFIQHEPGPLCTQLIDKPFAQNLDECLRYFTKNQEYGTAPGGTISGGRVAFWVPSTYTSNPQGIAPFPKPLAKVPTVTVWSDATGAVNSARDAIAAVDRAVSSVSVGSKAIVQLNLATASTVNYYMTFNYTADTGW